MLLTSHRRSMVDSVISVIEGGVAWVARRAAAMTYVTSDTPDKLASRGWASPGEPRQLVSIN